jgi:UDP-2,3-diacylglucosamine hydrolase
MSWILLLGDAHLRDGDPEVEAFVEFLETLPADVTGLYLLGDLFDLWIGNPSLTGPSHRRVVAALREVRKRGVRIAYVEGNRDYHLRSSYRGDPFDQLVEEALEISFGRRRLLLAHGDCVNRKDVPYRLWRWASKGPILPALLNLLPARRAAQLAVRLERSMARTNARHRASFPEAECRDYALKGRSAGFDTLVLGHFHQELERSYVGREGRVEVFVLPAWRDARRYLKIGAEGTARFESFRRRAAAE